jgi:hypothetical protein
MRRRPTNLPLLMGFIVSLGLHALLLPPLVLAMTATRDPSPISARFDPDDFTPPEEESIPAPEDEPDVELGIDAPTPSTLTWIGYEEYERHLATLGLTDQAAFRDEPAGTLAPPGGAVAPAPMQPVAETEASEPEPTDATETDEAPAEQPPPVAPPTELVNDSTTPPPPALQAPFDEAALATVSRMLGGVALDEPNQSEPIPPATRPPDKAPQTPDQSAETASEAEAEHSSRDKTLERIKELIAEAQRRAAEAPPTETAQPTEQVRDSNSNDAPNAGDQANKESDPTSVIEVPLDQVELGKPVARQGLELQPQRPEFTRLMKATASPGNPLVQITFGRDGRPVRARVLTGSGDARIDHAIEVSLYRWRAKGNEIDALADEQTLDVQLRIILNPRR